MGYFLNIGIFIVNSLELQNLLDTTFFLLLLRDNLKCLHSANEPAEN